MTNNNDGESVNPLWQTYIDEQCVLKPKIQEKTWATRNDVTVEELRAWRKNPLFNELLEITFRSPSSTRNDSYKSSNRCIRTRSTKTSPTTREARHAATGSQR